MTAVDWIIPGFLLVVLAIGAGKKIPVYDTFVAGAAEGLKLVWKILPSLMAVMLMVELMKASGLLDILQRLLAPALEAMGLPAEIAPLAVVRPFSGSASTGMLAEIFESYGPDSRAGLVASAILGSSETIFYTVALYCGTVGIRRTRYMIPVALLSQLVCMLAAGWMVRLLLPG